MSATASTLPSVTPPPRRQAGLARSTATVTRRTLLRYARTPQLIVLATVQMSLFFLIYRYMLGVAIHISGMPYVDYLVPSFIATGVLFSGSRSSPAPTCRWPRCPAGYRPSPCTSR